MALNPGVKWPTRTTAPGANYPYASAKDESSPGANDGTPYELARADDIFGFQQAILDSLGIVPSGNAETALVSQYLQGLIQYAAGKASFYDDSGAADAYVADAVSDQFAPDAYFAGMVVSFIPDNDNTGASTVDVNSLGAEDIKKESGAALAAGDLIAGRLAELKYDGTDFILISAIGAILQQIYAPDGVLATGTTVLPHDNSIPQNTEGDEYLSVTITPTKASNRLIIDGAAVLEHSVIGTTVSIALFKDSDAAALIATSDTNGVSGANSTVPLLFEMTAGTTSPITFKIRAGGAVAGTTFFNNKFGGVSGSFIRVKEISV